MKLTKKNKINNNNNLFIRQFITITINLELKNQFSLVYSLKPMAVVGVGEFKIKI